MRISPAGKRYTVHTGHTFHACLRIVLLNLALLILMANGMTKQPLRADVLTQEYRSLVVFHEEHGHCAVERLREADDDLVRWCGGSE